MHALGPLCREHHQAKRHILRFVNGAISWVTWVFEIFIYIQMIIRGLCEGTWCEGDAVYIYLTPQEIDLEGYPTILLIGRVWLMWSTVEGT